VLVEFLELWFLLSQFFHRQACVKGMLVLGLTIQSMFHRSGEDTPSL